VGEHIVIDGRFRGPADSANGGYACGTVAALLDGSAATVRLLKPPPLDEPLAVEREGDGVRLLADGEAVAQGRPAGGLTLVPPPLPSLELARESTERPTIEEHAYPTCFVCGPARKPPDGLGIFAGPVEGRDDHLIATTWTPDASLADAHSEVDDVFLWSALDCPTGNVAFYHWPDTLFLLGELTASIEAPVRAGEEYVLAAWPLERDGRKHHTAMAIATADGRIVARSSAIWISV
jgi:hypothetical protein